MSLGEVMFRAWFLRSVGFEEQRVSDVSEAPDDARLATGSKDLLSRECRVLNGPVEPVERSRFL